MAAFALFAAAVESRRPWLRITKASDRTAVLSARLGERGFAWPVSIVGVETSEQAGDVADLAMVRVTSKLMGAGQ